MITKVFSVYDSKALIYGVPFFMPTVGGAVRAFSDVCNDPQSTINRHGGDFSLFQLGEFDDSKGALIGISPYILLGHGSDFIANKAVADVSRAVSQPLATVAELNGDSRE